MPATNMYTIRGEVYRQHPWIARNPFLAMQEAKRIVDESMTARIPGGLLFGDEHAAQTKELLGGETRSPTESRRTRRSSTRSPNGSSSKGFVAEIHSVEELFAPATLSS